MSTQTSNSKVLRCLIMNIGSSIEPSCGATGAPQALGCRTLPWLKPSLITHHIGEVPSAPKRKMSSNRQARSSHVAAPLAHQLVSPLGAILPEHLPQGPASSHQQCLRPHLLQDNQQHSKSQCYSSVVEVTSTPATPLTSVKDIVNVIAPSSSASTMVRTADHEEC